MYRKKLKHGFETRPATGRRIQLLLARADLNNQLEGPCFFFFFFFFFVTYSVNTVVSSPVSLNVNPHQILQYRVAVPGVAKSCNSGPLNSFEPGQPDWLGFRNLASPLFPL